MRKNLQDTVLRAPLDGVVAQRLVDNHVQVQARQPVLLVEDFDALEVVIDLPERVIANVREAPREAPVGEAVFAVLPGAGGTRPEGMVIVLDGLSPGKQVVGTGAHQLQAWMRIQPFEVGMLSQQASACAPAMAPCPGAIAPPGQSATGPAA